MELNWNDHREQLNAQLKWQQVRNDFYGNICYEQKNCAARERAIAGGHISGSTDSMARYTNKHDERTAEVMDAHQFYNRVVCPLDQKIKQAYRDGDAAAHIAALIEANDVALQMLDMTNLGLDNDEFIAITKSLAAASMGSKTSEKKAAAARANGTKGGRPRKVVTWQASNGEAIDICRQCEKFLSGNWPRNSRGEEFSSVSHGLHAGTCKICNPTE